MRSKQFITLSLLLLCLSVSCAAQLWSGILSPSRAVNWANAGLPGGLPDTNWTQCGSTIAPYSGSGSTISNALSSCGANQYVQLGAGTFNLTSGISFNQKSYVVLRGMGADQTILNFSGSGAGNFSAVVAMEGSPSLPNSQTSGGGEQNVCDWTAGYAVGATTITLNNCGNTTPSAGNKANLAPNSTVLVLDQLDEEADNGTIWNCFQTYGSSNTSLSVCGSEGGSGDGNGGFAREDGPCYTISGSNKQCHRSQNQTVLVTGVSSCGTNCATVTISPGLYMPNWNHDNKRLPQAWWSSTSIAQDGLENLTLNNRNDSSQSPYSSTVNILGCYQCWVHGVRSLYGARSHVNVRTSKNVQIESSYFFESLTHQIVSYGIEFNNSSDGAVVNNIIQQTSDSSPSCTGACSGMFFAYNFSINPVWASSNNWLQAMNYRHSAGTNLNLDEGNISPGFKADNVHGTHYFETVFRNYFSGWSPTCFGGTCASETSPINLAAGSRYINIVGNVLGQSGYHNAYQCLAAPTCHPSNLGDGDTAIYGLQHTGGVGGCTFSSCTSVNGFCTNYPNCTSTSDYDPQVGNYLMRWGNYDTVTATSMFCTGDGVPASACPGDERAENAALYPGLSNPNSSFPASFYYSAQPAYMSTIYGTPPWPVIGPDVSGGNITGVGGHASKNAAELVFENAPVDTSMQHSYSFVSASWSGGTETLVFAGAPWNAAATCTTYTSLLCLPAGEVRIASGPLAGTYQVTGATANTVSFSLPSNPGSVSSGTLLYPNVRLFTALAYGNATSGPPPPPTNLKVTVH